MSFVDVKPGGKTESRWKAPDDIRDLQQSAEDEKVVAQIRTEEALRSFEVDSEWSRVAAAWQRDHLEAALEIFTDADQQREDSVSFTPASGVNTGEQFGVVVVKWPSEPEEGVDLVTFDVNDHVAVRIGDEWFVHYEVFGRTDDFVDGDDLYYAFWNELDAASGALVPSEEV